MKKEIVVMLAIAAIVLSSGFAFGETTKGGYEVTVQIQFGNGDIMNANVIVPEDNNTAFEATKLACENMSLDFNYTISTWGAFIYQIGWEKNHGNYSWFLYLWNDTTGSWELSPKGASSLKMSEGDVISWVFTQYNKTYAPIRMPYSMPGHYSASLSYRGSANNTGYYQNGVLANGTVWEFKGNYSWGFSSTPAVAYGMVFVADGAGLYAVGPGGVKIWNNSRGASMQSSPVIVGDKVIVGTIDGYLRAFYVTNGTMAWEQKISNQSVASSPKVDMINGINVVFIGTYESNAPWGKFYAFNADNGKELWNISLNSGVYFGTPAINNGSIFIPLRGEYNSTTYSFSGPYGFVCINESDGSVEWNVSYTEPVKFSPVWAGNYIYAPVGNMLVAYNSTGKEVWNLTLNGTVSSPAYHDGIVYVNSYTWVNGTSYSNVYAVNKSGVILWNTTIKGALYGGVILAGDYVMGVTGDKSSVVYWINSTSGNVVSKFNNTELSYVLSSPVIYDSMVLVSSGSDYLLALGTNGASLINYTKIVNPYIGQNMKVVAKGENVYQAYLYYRNSTRMMFRGVRMYYNATSGYYEADIPAQNVPCVVQYYVVFYNTDGTTEQSATTETTVAQPVPELNSSFIILVLFVALFVLVRRKL